MIQQLFDSLKEFIQFDAKTRNLLIGYALFVVYIVYLSNQNSTLIEQANSSHDNNEALINKSRQACEEQLEKNRDAYQQQFNAFVLKTNMEKDSIYNLFNKKLSTYEFKLKHNENILKKIENEMDN